MRIFTFRSFKDTGDSFGSPLEGRLTNTRSCPSAWFWHRGRLPNAWMLYWPLWGQCISFAMRKSYAALSYLWKRTSRVTRVTLVLWIGNETLRSLPSSSRCRQGSFRQRNLRSGWRVRQYDLMTSLRQRWRRAISQWIGVILYGFRLGHAVGVPDA